MKPITLTYPGVYIEEIQSGVRTIMGVATSGDRHRIAEAVERELARLFTEGTPPSLAHGGEIDKLRRDV